MSHLIDIISLSSDSDDFYNSNINSDHSNISIETVSATYDGSSTIDKVNEGVKKTKNGNYIIVFFLYLCHLFYLIEFNLYT